MVKIVVKKEGATQTCGKCGTVIICRLKTYGGNFAATLQWQNLDATPHFKTPDGKNYTCNVPDEEEPTRIPSESPPATTPGPPPPTSSSQLAILNAIEDVNLRLQKMDEMIQAIFRYTVDEQLSKKK